MFDIGFPELMLVAVIGLLVLGPERLPEALRTLGLWLGRLRRSFGNVKAEIEKEIGMDEIRRQLHNEAVMEEMKRIEDEVRGIDAGVDRAAGDAADPVKAATDNPGGGSNDAAPSKPDLAADGSTGAGTADGKAPLDAAAPQAPAQQPLAEDTQAEATQPQTQHGR